MSVLITEEMVEAAGLELANACTHTGGGEEVCDCPTDEQVRIILTAAAPLIAGRSLHQAADAWLHGEWADAPRRADPAQERIANGQHVGDWLRARAAKTEGAGA